MNESIRALKQNIRQKLKDMNDCLFCKSATGEISGTKVYEDKRVLAFCGIAPQAPGHVLVTGKSEKDELRGRLA